MVVAMQDSRWWLWRAWGGGCGGLRAVAEEGSRWWPWRWPRRAQGGEQGGVTVEGREGRGGGCGGGQRGVLVVVE